MSCKDNAFSKISIITPSYEQGDYIQQNIRSVLSQAYQQFEHIIIDGGSTDETQSVLNQYPHLIWLSERDEGQGHALMKGLALASGSIIGWINSDDYYLPRVFGSVARAFADPNVQWVVGNVIIAFDSLGKEIRTKSPKITYHALLADADILRQQAAFFRRSFLVDAGGFDKRYHLVMDYDLWIRLAKRSEPKMIDEYWAVFRMHPQQKTTGRNLLKQIKEIRSIQRRERAPFLVREKFSAKKYLHLAKHLLKIGLIKTGFLDDKYSHYSLKMWHIDPEK